jgi:hypothetical protein
MKTFVRNIGQRVSGGIRRPPLDVNSVSMVLIGGRIRIGRSRNTAPGAEGRA